MWLLLLVSLFSPAFACDDPEALLVEVESAVGEARLEDAQGALKRLETSFGCSPFVEASILARMWLAEGVLFYFNGDVESTKLSFGAARGVAPDVWDTNYGADLRAIFDGVEVDGTKGAIGLVSPVEGYLISVDGVQTELPVSVGPGLHLVQIGETPTASRFAQIVYVMAEDSLSLNPKLPKLAPKPVEPVAEVAAPAAEPVAEVAQPVVEVAQPVAEVAQPVAEVAQPAVTTPAQDPVAPVPAVPEPVAVRSSRVSKIQSSQVKKEPKNRTFLITGGVTLGAGLGLAGLAWAENKTLNPAIEDWVENDSLAGYTAEQVSGAIARQRVFGTTAYALMGLGSVGLVVHFVPKGK